MKAFVDRFDRWVQETDLAPADLARYRVVFAVTMLLTLGDVSWVSEYPDSMFDPPPGPMYLFGSFPPAVFFEAVEVALLVALTLLAFGIRARLSAVVVALLLLVGDGFSYSLGKIDHTILLIITPLLLAVAGWERRDDREVRLDNPWAMRLLALTVGLGFVTAAAPKVTSGWLDPGSQAVQGTLFRQYHVNGRTDFLAGTFIDLRSVVFWEAADWFTIALEAGLVLLVIRWRLWRIGLAIATLFHLGVFLMMNITFAGNVVVYGAFVRWSRVRLPRLPRLPSSARPLLVIASVVAAIAWHATDGPQSVVARSILIVGAAASIVHLASQAASAVLRRSTRNENQAGPVSDTSAD